MKQAISNRRLLKLAEFLKTIPPKRFDYSRWVGQNWTGAQDLSCGTTACALGWATTMPTFRRLGLRLYAVRSDDGNVLSGHITLASDPAASSIGAAMQVFGLNYDEACFIFLPVRYLDFSNQKNELSPVADATPQQVAYHIERFIKNRKLQVQEK